uniref:PX domain-containing protein n=1 Tax=Hyaloperonospora arabidopsidis (strain Emoy2) TaxID=559515 RepID=M4BEU6_HYAAE
MGCSHSTSAADDATSTVGVLSMESVDPPAVETCCQESGVGSSHEGAVKSTVDDVVPVAGAASLEVVAEEAHASAEAVRVEEEDAAVEEGGEVIEVGGAVSVSVKGPLEVEEAVNEATAEDEVVETEEVAEVAVAAVEEEVEAEEPVPATAIEDLVHTEIDAAATAMEDSVSTVQADAVPLENESAETEEACEEPIKMEDAVGASAIEGVVETEIVVPAEASEESVETGEAVTDRAVEKSVEAEEAPAAEAAVEAGEELVEASAPVDEAALPLDDDIPVEEVKEAHVLAGEKNVPTEAKLDEVTDVAESVDEGDASVSKSAVDVTAEETAPVNEYTSEEVSTARVSETKPAESFVFTFTAEDVTFDDNGVAFYNYDGSSFSSDSSKNDVHVSKRYSEFKALHAQLTDEQITDLPALPKAPFLQARNSPRMLEDRKTGFSTLLNAIAAHPTASQSAAFKTFLA